MLQKLLKARTKKVGVQELRGHKPPSCPSLMARGLRIHARLCRLSGCFFIRDLFSTSDRATPRVVWKSWYTLYSCGCFASLVFAEHELYSGLAQEWKARQDRLNSDLRLSVMGLLSFRVALNFMCMLLCSSKIAAFQQRATAFEKRIGILSCDCCAPRRFFWSDVQRVSFCVLYCTLFSLATLSDEPSTDVAQSPFMQTLSWAKRLHAMFLYFTYDSICAVSLRSSGQVLSEYLQKLLNTLVACLDTHRVSSMHPAQLAGRLEGVRLGLSTVRQLKEEINHIWRWPLIASSMCVLLVPSLLFYEASKTGFVVKPRYDVILYAVYFVCDFAALAFTSQSMINKAKEVKNACKAARSTRDVFSGSQILFLLNCIDSEDMGFKGANFFHLSMSTLISMGATIITYSVILLQTGHSLNK